MRGSTVSPSPLRQLAPRLCGVQAISSVHVCSLALLCSALVAPAPGVPPIGHLAGDLDSTEPRAHVRRAHGRVTIRLRGGASSESSGSFLELLPEPREAGPSRPTVGKQPCAQIARPGDGLGLGDTCALDGRLGKRRHLPLDRWVEDGLRDEPDYKGAPATPPCAARKCITHR